MKLTKAELILLNEMLSDLIEWDHLWRGEYASEGYDQHKVEQMAQIADKVLEASKK